MEGTVLVDTDVVSFFVKDDTRAAQFDPLLQDQRVAVSFMTLAELDQWVLLSNWGKSRREHLESQLEKYLLLPYDRELCRWWAAVRVAARNAGRPIEVGDAWIAATALLYDIPLVTHNPGDYAGVPGLRLPTPPADG